MRTRIKTPIRHPAEVTHGVEPRLVGEIEYRSLGPDGAFRHPL
ncbi:hypothetical protein [Pseudonocardia sp. GCM10023141]